jgi:hypothetical protein
MSLYLSLVLPSFLDAREPPPPTEFVRDDMAHLGMPSDRHKLCIVVV